MTEVSTAAGHVDRAVRLATELAAVPGLTVTVAKQLIDALPGAGRDTGLLLEQLAYAALAEPRAR